MGAILGRGTGTSKIRVRVRVRVGLGLGLGLGFRRAFFRLTRTRLYFGGEARHIYVSIGYRLSSLDMGTCARVCRLGAILGRGTVTSKIRVIGLGFRGAKVDMHVNILEKARLGLRETNFFCLQITDYRLKRQ